MLHVLRSFSWKIFEYVPKITANYFLRPLLLNVYAPQRNSKILLIVQNFRHSLEWLWSENERTMMGNSGFWHASKHKLTTWHWGYILHLHSLSLSLVLSNDSIAFYDLIEITERCEYKQKEEIKTQTKNTWFIGKGSFP